MIQIIYLQLIVFTLTDPFKKTVCFLYLNHKNIFFSERRDMYRYHFSMRDNFHYGDERILL